MHELNKLQLITSWHRSGRDACKGGVRFKKNSLLGAPEQLQPVLEKGEPAT